MSAKLEELVEGQTIFVLVNNLVISQEEDKPLTGPFFNILEGTVLKGTGVVDHVQFQNGEVIEIESQDLNLDMAEVVIDNFHSFFTSFSEAEKLALECLRNLKEGLVENVEHWKVVILSLENILEGLSQNNSLVLNKIVSDAIRDYMETEIKNESHLDFYLSIRNVFSHGCQHQEIHLNPILYFPYEHNENLFEGFTCSGDPCYEEVDKNFSMKNVFSSRIDCLLYSVFNAKTTGILSSFKVEKDAVLFKQKIGRMLGVEVQSQIDLISKILKEEIFYLDKIKENNIYGGLISLD